MRADEAAARYSRNHYERRSAHDHVGAKAPKRYRGLKIALIAALAVVLAGVCATFGYSQFVNWRLHAGLDDDFNNALVKTDLTREPFYMVLLGTDGSSERENDASFGGTFRTDSIMLARIDPVENKAALVSIHRDSMIDLGEHGMQKINAAYAFGGAKLAVQAVSQKAGVGVSHYASIDFDGFKSIVDALGGVEVDVPVTIDDSDAGGHVDAGLQTLTGDQALILCRSRNTYGDYVDPDSMRAANQRLVLSAIAKKVLSSDVVTIARMADALSQYVTTDLNVSDIIGLAQAMRGLDPACDLYTAMEPIESEYVDGGWYSYTVEDEWKRMIARMDAGLPPSAEAIVDERTGTVVATNGSDGEAISKKTAFINVKNGNGVAGVADQAVKLLAQAGFANVAAGNANSFDYESTLVVYDNPNQEYEASMIVEALGQGRAMLNDGNYLYDGDFLVVIGLDWR